MDRYAFSFYILIPLSQGLFFTFSQSGSQPMDGVVGHMAYWLLPTLLVWQLLALGSALAATALRPIGVPLVVPLMIGFMLGIAVWTLISPIRDALVVGFVQEGFTLREIDRFSDLSISLSNWGVGASLWIASNYLFFWFLGVPRFGYKPEPRTVAKFRSWLFSSDLDKSSQPRSDTAEEVQAAAAENDETLGKPRLIKRLKTKDPSPILALVAEDHYTKVVMAKHTELVYIRFSDAIEEMKGRNGFQVHRSYWISADAAETYWEKGHRAFIKLSNGETVPVSRSFRVSVKQAGLFT